MDKRLSPDELALDLVVRFEEKLQDQKRVHALILAHEHFLPSKNLFSVLTKRFTSADQSLQIRYFALLKKWIDFCRPQFLNPEGLGNLIQKFMTSLGDNPYVPRLKSSLAGEVPQTGLDDDDDGEQVPATLKKTKKKDYPEILNYEAHEIARQLSLIDFVYLVNVDKKELLNSKWTCPTDSPTLKARSDRLDHLAYWLAHELLIAKPKHKKKILSQYLKICHYLMQVHNYHSLMGFHLGINFLPTNIFSALLQSLPAKLAAQWKKVAKLMDYSSNYANFRETFKDVQNQTRIIPCQEIFLKDLLFCYGSVSDFNSDGSINLDKLQLIGERIDDFRKSQESNFGSCFSKYQVLYDFLENIPTNITIEMITTVGAPSPSHNSQNSESESSQSTASFLADATDSKELSASRSRTGSNNASHHLKPSNPQRSLSRNKSLRSPLVESRSEESK